MSEKRGMDKTVMERWEREVLAPYVKKAPESVRPIIILDQYKCHLMGHIVRMIQNIGCQVEHIPTGCTLLFQPVDVGYNCPFKCRLQNLWSDWMMDHNINDPLFEAPS